MPEFLNAQVLVRPALSPDTPHDPRLLLTPYRDGTQLTPADDDGVLGTYAALLEPLIAGHPHHRWEFWILIDDDLQRAVSLEAALHGEVQRNGKRPTLDHDGVLTCACENSSYQDGFETCTRDGAACQPTIEWSGHCRCIRCGRIIDASLRYQRGALARLLRRPDVRTIDRVPVNVLTRAVTWSLLTVVGPHDADSLAQSTGWSCAAVDHVLALLEARGWLEPVQERGTTKVRLSSRGSQRTHQLIDAALHRDGERAVTR
ncbi:hypothetical protein [Nonomuraea sp. SYSU D8015]|uniref:hypothetical protein n=1 Tax=Nonomuraea sp. SYSU D8015 TaxID=2593644 RepID=UPI001660253D|nr:hypothetical protein [Nonomuraea sp. SYSU D8015]